MQDSCTREDSMSDIICGEEVSVTSSSVEKNSETTSTGDVEVHQAFQMVVMLIESPTACTMDAYINETETVQYKMNFTY